ncbi:MAG: tRNA uridine-5-carboxymethylaminomethyl(34) synthesis GTPase MnmE [Lachnospiraceae bacterium]|nr:tRNA uridine-5-carboxymethylaminomethyl(34) synthesis GTPase MnmE [Lachnospiraceae bacterium]
MYKDTIAAISTAVSESGIGIIRISGENAFQVIDRVYRAKGKQKKLSEEKSHTIHYGFVCDGDEIIDEVLVMLMRGPRSFTAEDTVEINCHGGVYAMKRILETVLKYGARPAEPGEFTKRAFLNGRIDLSQAEAVMDVIQAKNEYALKSSVSQLRGSVYRMIRELREELLYHIAFIESALDDPEHISLEGYPDRLFHENEKWMEKLTHLIHSAENGRRMKEGIKTVIAGKPNAGKSSLLNALLGQERAIVTDVAGTTRDILTETISLHGITLNLMDTAGIRETDDLVEKIGVEKARENVRDADLVIYVADSSTRLDQNDEKIIEMLQGKKAVVLLNKTDLEPVITEDELQDRVGDHKVLPISARNDTGIEQLEQVIRDMFYQGEISFNDQIYITNIRQKNLMINSLESLRQVEKSIQAGMPEDFFSIDLMSAYEALGGIIGEQTGEDLVNEIFSKFCMGK